MQYCTVVSTSSVRYKSVSKSACGTLSITCDWISPSGIGWSGCAVNCPECTKEAFIGLLVPGMIPNARGEAHEAARVAVERQCSIFRDSFGGEGQPASACCRETTRGTRRDITSLTAVNFRHTTTAAMTRYRRRIREVQVNRRHGALSAGERRRMKSYQLTAAGLSAGAENARYIEEKDRLRLQSAMLCMLVCHMRIDRTELPPSVRADPISIEDISVTDAWTNYRCRKADFPRLLNALRFPQRWVCNNGSNYPGESALLLLIYRLRYPNRLTDLQQHFGRDYTQLSRIFNEVVDWMWRTHRHRLVDYLHFYEPHFAEMAVKIEEKGGIACSGANIVGFLGGTPRTNCRPGGPRELHEELSDGRHRNHGLAHQSLVFPNGMIGDLYGPSVESRHDACLLEKSKLNDRLARLQEKNETQYNVYGDAASPIASHVDRGFAGAELSEAQEDCNRELSRLRGGAEWMFGKVAEEFAFVDFEKNLKTRKKAIAKYYCVAAVLTNARTCLYGSVTGFFFGMAAPSLEDYFA